MALITKSPVATLIAGFILLSLLCSVSTESNTAYVESANLIHDAKKQIRDQLLSMDDNIPDVTDSRRHYAVIINHFLEVADALAWDYLAGYEDVYIHKMPQSIVFGLTNVEKVLESVIEKNKNFDEKVKKIETLIETMCSKTMGPAICNNIVDQIVNGDPERYRYSANVLLAGGAMAKEFLNAELVPVADEYKEINFLINHMEDLKDFVYALAERIRDGKIICDA